MAHVRAMAIAPRPAGSNHQARSRSYLITTLRYFGLKVDIQEGTGTTAWPGGTIVAPIAT